MDEVETRGMLEGLDLGRRRPEAGEMVFIRELGQGDVATLRAPNPPATIAPRVLNIRHSHHLLAQQIAKGHTMAECALITGYAPTTIAQIKAAPAFQELIQFYLAEADRVFAVGLERMQALGLSSLDELQRRLEDESDGWTKRELMELAELMLVKGRPGGGVQAGGGVPPVNINVKFVQAETPHITIDQMASEKD